MEDDKILKTKLNIIRQGLKKIANININTESLKKAKIHALLSRGDQKCADIIQKAVKNGWPSAIRENKEYCHSIIYNEKDINEPLPWDFLKTHVSKEFLAKEYLKAKDEKQSAPCPMIDCRQCQICI